MRKNTRFFTHTSWLTALFVLGNTVITLPSKNSDEFTFLGYLLAVMIGFSVYFISLFTVKIFILADFKTKKFKKIAAVIICFAVAVFSLFVAADSFKSFIIFAKEIILPNTPMFFIVLIFLILVLFFATRSSEALLKFFFLTFFICLAVILFFFISASFRFNLRNIFVFKIPKVKTLYDRALPYFYKSVLPVVLLPFFNAFTFKKSRMGASLTGLTVGYILLGLCVVGSVLLFGGSFAGELNYPFSALVSTISIGRLFSRLDGFSYFLYFFCALAKISVAALCLNKAVENCRKIW